MTTMTTKEVLIAARAKIEKPEMWKQGGGIGRNGECCTWLAVGNPDGSWSETLDSARDCLLKAIGRRVGSCPGISEIFEWNDDPARTHDEVLAAFDKAIALAEKEGGGDEHAK